MSVSLQAKLAMDVKWDEMAKMESVSPFEEKERESDAGSSLNNKKSRRRGREEREVNEREKEREAAEGISQGRDRISIQAAVCFVRQSHSLILHIHTLQMRNSSHKG